MGIDTTYAGDVLFLTKPPGGSIRSTAEGNTVRAFTLRDAQPSC